MSKLQDLKSNLVLDINPAIGSVLNQASSSYNPAVTGVMNWSRTQNGNAIQFGSTGVLHVTRDATLDAIDEFTVLFFGEVPAQLTGTNQHIFNKGTGYQLYVPPSSGYLLLFSGATTSSSTVDVKGAKMIGVTIASGQKPKFYKNGIYAETGNNALTITSNTTNLSIGNYGPGATDSYNTEGKYNRILFFNRVLTDQEISEINNELSTQRGAGDPKTRNFHFFPDLKPEPYLKLAFDTTKTGDGKIADLSGNNKNGTLTGMVLATQDGIKRLEPTGATPKVDFGTPLSSSVTKATLECVIGGSQFIFGNKTATVRFCIRKIAGNIYTYAEGGGGNYGSLADTNTDIRHMALVYDGSGAANADRLKLYINNVEQTLSFTGTIPATLGDMSARNVLLNEDTGGTYGDGKYVYGNLIEEALSSTEVANRYKRYAQHAVYQSESHKWLPTLANVTAGQIGNSGWEVRDGTWNILELEDTKLIASSAGIARAILPNQKRAYGTWVFEIYRPNTTTDINVYLVYDETANNGIMLNFYYDEGIYLKRILAGLVGTLAWTSASYIDNNVVYKVAVSRSTTGEITMYIKGGAYTKWQKITVAGGGTNPVTYAPVTTSEKAFLYSSAGMDFNFLGIHQGILSMNELEAIY